MDRLWLSLLASLIVAPLAHAGGISAGREGELRNLVIQDCGSCHGLTMRGGLGKPLLPEALKPLSDEAIAEVILAGVSGTPMPPWRGLLDEDDALWIARFLKQGVE